MALLNRKTDYALLILAHLHGRPEGGSVREIAERFGLSQGFLANILKELCQKGFVASRRGVKGGYVLQRPASAVTVAELLAATDEEFQLASCSGHEHSPGGNCQVSAVCPIRRPLAELHRRLFDVFRAVTLAELFRPGLPPAEVMVPLMMPPAARGVRRPGPTEVNDVVKLPIYMDNNATTPHRPARGRGDAAVLHREVRQRRQPQPPASAGRPRRPSSEAREQIAAPDRRRRPRRSSSPAAPPRATTWPSRAWPRCTRRRATTSSRP